MEFDTGQSNELIPTTSHLKSDNKESIDPEPALLSPLGISRYGRTRKPKITEDFYNIDVIFENAKDNRKVPQIKSPVVKPALKAPPAVHPIAKPKVQSSKSPKGSSKPKHFVHVTGDTVADESAAEVVAKSARKFFKKEPAKTEDAENEAVSSDITALSDVETMNVNRVLKMISSKTQDDPSTNNSTDSKAGAKQVLKTYTNKRKSFQKNATVVESFGLPDKPIFPMKDEKCPNEPKRIKSLDVATPSSTKDINIVGRELMDVPWKIGSNTTDFEAFCDEQERFLQEFSEQNHEFMGINKYLPKKTTENDVYENDEMKLKQVAVSGSPSTRGRLSKKLEISKENDLTPLDDTEFTDSKEKELEISTNSHENRTPNIFSEGVTNINTEFTEQSKSSDTTLDIYVNESEEMKTITNSYKLSKESSHIVPSVSSNTTSNKEVPTNSLSKSKQVLEIDGHKSQVIKSIPRANQASVKEKLQVVEEKIKMRNKSPKKQLVGNEISASSKTLIKKEVGTNSIKKSKHSLQINVHKSQEIKTTAITNKYSTKEKMHTRSKSPKKQLIKNELLLSPETFKRKKEERNSISNVNKSESSEKNLNNLQEKKIKTKSPTERIVSDLLLLPSNTRHDKAIESNARTNTRSSTSKPENIKPPKGEAVLKNEGKNTSPRKQPVVELFNESNKEEINIQETIVGAKKMSKQKEVKHFEEVKPKTRGRSPRKQVKNEKLSMTDINASKKNTSIERKTKTSKNDEKDEDVNIVTTEQKSKNKSSKNQMIERERLSFSPNPVPETPNTKNRGKRTNKVIDEKQNNIKEEQTGKRSARKQIIIVKEEQIDDTNIGQKTKRQMKNEAKLNEGSEKTLNINENALLSPKKRGRKAGHQSPVKNTRGSTSPKKEIIIICEKMLSPKANVFDKIEAPSSLSDKSKTISPPKHKVVFRTSRQHKLPKYLANCLMKSTSLRESSRTLRSFTSPSKEMQSLNMYGNNIIDGGKPLSRTNRKSGQVVAEEKETLDTTIKIENISDNSIDLDDVNLLERSRFLKEEAVSEDETVITENKRNRKSTLNKKIIKKSVWKRQVKRTIRKVLGSKIRNPLPTNSSFKLKTENVALGDLMWAKIGCHPYWPCLVTKDPVAKIYKKNTTKGNFTLYHVRFFGDNGRRSWANATSIIPYINKDDLSVLYEKAKRNAFPSAITQSYSVKEGSLPKWNIAVSEAESLKSSTIDKRFDFFFDMFASNREKKKRLRESLGKKESEMVKEVKQELLDSPLDVEEVPRQCKTPKPSCSPTKLKPSRSKSLPPSPNLNNNSLKVQSDEKVKKGKDTVENIPKNNLLEPPPSNLVVEKKKNNTNTVEEPMETFFKNPWQSFQVPKRQLSTPLNEVTSEYSLSDSDSLSKSSSNTNNEQSTYKEEIARQKKHYLFKGVSRERVCQVCKKPRDILKCKGPCSGLFHYKCGTDRITNNDSILIIKEESSESEGFIDFNVGKEGLADETTIEQVVDCATKEDVELKETNMKEQGNKVEIVRIDCDESDTEHMLTPKVRLTPNVEFSGLSLAEQIDLKMKEVMQKFEKDTRYADSTTDYTSSEESTSHVVPSESKVKVAQKKKSLKIKHVTADSVSFCENTSSEDCGDGAPGCFDNNGENSNGQGVTSSELMQASNNILQTDIVKTTGNAQLDCENDLNPHKDFKCRYCIAQEEPPCYVCDKEVSSKDTSFRQKCSLHMCGKFYHPDCLKLWPQTQWSLISTAKHKNSNKRLDTFVCPMHVCHTCTSDNPHAAIARCTSDKVVKCLRCPATYHTTNYCVPAGTLILSTSQIVCPRHLGQKVVKKGKVYKYTRTINTPWCFICSKGGDLICCETCPTSVHTDCLQINLLEDGTFICEDCETGRFPLYDEIVWVKLGTYRWWPALILFPNEVPINIMHKPHTKGEFVVKFFGTHDHYWVCRGRVFLFQEGDRGHHSPAKKRVDALFKKSIEEAAAAHQLKKVFKLDKEAEIRTGLKPPPYIRIKVNRPVGNVRGFDGNVSNTTSCDCDPNQLNPCGPDSLCLNRLLLTECDPNVCLAKERCNNQRFEKRQYPPMIPFRTPARGWGLKTLAPIKKGEFVVEYVGEVIDDQEYQRRICKMHEQKDENYYFLTIDKDRIIDAGPKGNLARFMNHCCQPNCDTQKWTINGDTRVGLFAITDIALDAELTFNYNLECIGKEKKICKCEAPNCSGFIGVKVKGDESQKKPKKSNNSFKKKKQSAMISKNDGPCFICGELGDVGACYNKICMKYYHLHCVKLDVWPEGKWVCPWHNCNTCGKRTIRCCVKCINSYCPVHSEGNVRYDKLLGFICSEHDPTKESHDIPGDNLGAITNSQNSTTTKETDVTSTTPDEMDQQHSAKGPKEDDACPIENPNQTLAESITSTPIKKKDLSSFVHSLRDYENSLYPDVSSFEGESPVVGTGKRKRGRRKRDVANNAKRIKLSNVAASEVVPKPKPKFVAANLLGIIPSQEIKLSSSVPTRHLRATRNSTATSMETKRFLNRETDLEKDLPIRKRSRARCESLL